MASTYHPIFSGLWNDDALEGLSFECHGFFAFLCSNDHVRPSGIYRVTDPQIVAETGLRLGKVRQYLSVLAERKRIVRDGAWMFVCGYFKRQPKGDSMLAAVRKDVENCSSNVILEAFSLKYPLFHRWSADRRATLGRPPTEHPPSEQSITEQSRAVQSRGPSGDGPPLEGLSLTMGRPQAPTKGQYFEILKQLAAEHPDWSKSKVAEQALATLQRQLKP
jgi:hypothetical protein